MRNLILLAVQGAGKGTLAKKLKEKYGYVHISTGDILRDRAKTSDELGLKIKKMMDEGLLVPDEIIFEAIAEKIKSNECKNGYIMDGCPRNLKQAKMYDEMVKSLGIDGGIAINMTIPDDLLLKRITGRRICSECGAIYNIYNKEMAPLKEGVCNLCGGSLYQRSDDNEDAIKKRVDTYYSTTMPVVHYYKDKDMLYEVDSTDSNIAFKSVQKILKDSGDKID